VREGGAVPGEYVAGWIKRGPTGIIGTNKKDANATVDALLADARDGRLPSAPHPSLDAFDARLAQLRTVSTAGWRAIDAEERRLGVSRGRERTTVHEVDALLDAAGA
jgi:ferredoxin--NADP+ reductase